MIKRVLFFFVFVALARAGKRIIEQDIESGERSAPQVAPLRNRGVTTKPDLSKRCTKNNLWIVKRKFEEEAWNRIKPLAADFSIPTCNQRLMFNPRRKSQISLDVAILNTVCRFNFRFNYSSQTKKIQNMSKISPEVVNDCAAKVQLELARIQTSKSRIMRSSRLISSSLEQSLTWSEPSIEKANFEFGASNLDVTTSSSQSVLGNLGLSLNSSVEGDNCDFAAKRAVVMQLAMLANAEVLKGVYTTTQNIRACDMSAQAGGLSTFTMAFNDEVCSFRIRNQSFSAAQISNEEELMESSCQSYFTEKHIQERKNRG